MSDTNKRSIGPVTTATTTAAAATTVIFWALGHLGVTAPELVQGAVTILLVAGAGWLVRPGSGARRA